MRSYSVDLMTRLITILTSGVREIKAARPYVATNILLIKLASLQVSFGIAASLS
jgi:hypothetical protein